MAQCDVLTETYTTADGLWFVQVEHGPSGRPSVVAHEWTVPGRYHISAIIVGPNGLSAYAYPDNVPQDVEDATRQRCDALGWPFYPGV